MVTVVAVAASWGVTPAKADAPSDELAFVAAINKTRAGVGLAPLKVSDTLVTVARGWAEKMRQASVAIGTDDCTISHNPNLRTAVNLNWRKLGENVGCGDVGVDGLHTAFVNSPKHYANIVDPSFDYIGIGIVYEGDVMFVTEQFMDIDETQTTAPSPTAPINLALTAPKSVPTRVLSAAPIKSTAKAKATTKRKRT